MNRIIILLVCVLGAFSFQDNAKAQELADKSEKDKKATSKPSDADPKSKEEKKPEDVKPTDTMTSLEGLEQQTITAAKEALASGKHAKASESILKLTPFRDYWRSHAEALEKMINATKQLCQTISKNKAWEDKQIADLMKQYQFAKEKQHALDKLLQALYKK